MSVDCTLIVAATDERAEACPSASGLSTIAPALARIHLFGECSCWSGEMPRWTAVGSWNSVILFGALVLGSVSTCNAQRLHLVTAVDSLEPRIGGACELDGGAVRGAFSLMVEKERLIVTSVPAKDAQTVLNAVDSVQSNPTDTIVFYYSGHGFYDREGPKFYFSSTRSTLRRIDLREHLLRRPARLHVILTDCCNNYFESKKLRLRDEVHSRSKHQTTPLMSSLFFESSGIVDITSSGQDEMSLVRSPNEGSVFTIQFVDFLKENAMQKLKWPQTFSVIAANTEKESRSIYGLQDASKRQLKTADGSMIIQEKQTPVQYGLAD